MKEGSGDFLLIKDLWFCRIWRACVRYASSHS